MNIIHLERFTFLLTILLFVCSEISFSQIVKTYPKTYLELRDDIDFLPTTLNTLLTNTEAASNLDSLYEEKTQKTYLLSQASLSYDKSKPRISLNLFKYLLELSDSLYIPIAIQMNLAALNEVSIDNSVSSLLDEFGGLGNVSFELLDKRLKLFGLIDPPNEKNGLFLESKLGAKAVDIVNVEDNDSNLVGFVQALGSLRLNLRLVNTDQEHQGNLTALLSASFQYSNESSYLSMFEEEISSTLFNLNFSAAFRVTDQFSINGGRTLKTNEDLIDDYWFFSASIIPQK